MEDCIGVSRVGLSGGLALMWKAGVSVKLLSLSPGYIDSFVEMPGLEGFYFTGFYGNLEASLRKFSWELLRRLSKPTSTTWLVCGDFNEIISSDEKLGGGPRNQCQMREFREVLDFCNSRRIPFLGFKYTWDNRREGEDNTKLVLDRGYLNPVGHTLFPQAQIEHIIISVFDHLCLLVALKGLDGQLTRKKANRFHFELAWTREEGCEEVVANSWGEWTGCASIPDI